MTFLCLYARARAEEKRGEERTGKEMEYDAVSKRKRGVEIECNRFNTAEGCSYGDACRFKHVPLPPDKTTLTDSLTGKTKACTKFFSTSGCPYGEGCHFSHYVPGGMSSITPGSLANSNTGSNVRKIHGGISSMAMSFNDPTSSDPGSVLGGSKILCNKFGTLEGCRFGDKCHFAHGVKELRGSHESFATSEHDGRTSFDILKDRVVDVSTLNFGRMIGPSGLSQHESNHSAKDAVTSFGASSIASISIDANLSGAIIGKNGINVKHICQLTGAKLSILDSESDSNLRNVEIQGSLEQIQQASQMVRELLFHMGPLPSKPTGFGPQNYKTKLCANHAQGKCTFAERCHFAHGASEMQDHSFRT